MIKCTKSDSKNKKLGQNVRATYRKVGETCPNECSLLNNGCYAQRGPTNIHSESSQRDMQDGEKLYAYLKILPSGKKIRHLVSGDLFYKNVKDKKLIKGLLEGHYKREDIEGWAYTHGWSRLDPIKLNGPQSLCVNASCDSLEDAVEAYKQGWPTTVVVPEDTQKNEMKLKIQGEDVPVVVCPEQTDGVSCSDCGLCMNSDRKAIVGFRKH